MLSSVNSFAEENIDCKRIFSVDNRDNSYISYEEAIQLIRENNIQSLSDYYRLVLSQPKLRLPFRPQFIYSDQWYGFDVFFGKKEKPNLSYSQFQNIIIRNDIVTEEEYNTFLKANPNLNLLLPIQKQSIKESGGAGYFFHAVREEKKRLPF